MTLRVRKRQAEKRYPKAGLLSTAAQAADVE
jgi:hypothetical protein